MSESPEGVYLFCAGPSGGLTPGPPLAGYGAEPLEALPLSPLVLWIQPLRQPPARTAEAVLTHHRVVEEAWRRTSALAPMRFGHWFRDRPALVRALEPRVQELGTALERVKGAGEHAVRVAEVEGEAPMEGPREAATRASMRSPADAPSEEPRAANGTPAETTGRASAGSAPGRAYMEALALRERRWHEREARGRRVAAELAEGLDALIRDERVEPLREGGLVSVAHLVDRQAEEAYAAAVDAFAADRPALRVVRGGPWPPYSFVS